MLHENMKKVGTLENQKISAGFSYVTAFSHVFIFSTAKMVNAKKLANFIGPIL